MAEFDASWKRVAETFFPEMIGFFMPDAYDDIDWSQPVVSLDGDLPKEKPGDAVGDRRVDKLFRVSRHKGEPRHVYLHIEFQNEVDEGLAERMYIYNSRIFNKYRGWIVSLAVLGDANPDWRSEPFGFGLWGHVQQFEFRIVKLMQFLASRERLEGLENGFGLIVLAHLAGKLTRNRMAQRMEDRLSITRVLISKKLDLKRFQGIIRFIESVIDLPEALEQTFQEKMRESLGEDDVAYMSNFEKYAMNKGRQEGRQEGLIEGRAEGELTAQAGMLLRLLKTRFGDCPAWILRKIESAGQDQLLQWFDFALTAGDLDAVFGSEA